MVKSHETKSLFMTELRTLRSGKLKCFVKQIKILGRGNSGEEFAFFKEKLFTAYLILTDYRQIYKVPDWRRSGNLAFINAFGRAPKKKIEM